MNAENISRSDWLALQRTRLANERTFLAYFRTFVVVFGTGLTIVKVEILQSIVALGYTFLGVAIVLLAIGVTRFLLVRKRLKNYYHR